MEKINIFSSSRRHVIEYGNLLYRYGNTDERANSRNAALCCFDRDDVSRIKPHSSGVFTTKHAVGLILVGGFFVFFFVFSLTYRVENDTTIGDLEPRGDSGKTTGVAACHMAESTQ